MSSDALIALDRAHVWHPYASTTAPGPLYRVVAAQRSTLTLTDGTTTSDVVDAMSSWWCMIHGYKNPTLDAAAHAQIDDFAHVMFGGLTHEPAIHLAQDLIDLTPEPLNRVFLADSGSVAVEVALKLARQIQQTRGFSRRTKIASLRGGYHGDTLGAMSVCDPDGGMHAAFSGAIPSQVFLPRPPSVDADNVDVWAAEARTIVEQHRDELAAIIVEPILQGAGGMRAYSPLALAALRTLADEFDLLLIADEIATGFGRTGKLFACEWADIVPDVLVVGKALTGGYMTQAAMITRDSFGTELGQGSFQALMHGPTFMANPLACAVSRASLALVGSYDLPALTGRIAALLTDGLAPLAGHPHVADVRIFGASAAVELRQPH
ncbi:aspartate carbamoyltransferase catalytic subunit [Platysternon megacephalum]|uniref:Aspartate carbamoyltransferase catalytic subunit n=1 Tax=Platysternon megacephalum TaxID=55544 RepID=A0A4D9DK21_9SAUR|nr:aspartate carbamoyltransferase catalytic subunit [Platysternon megacephalum]